ncbi:MAG: hypothetical protein ATN36_06915 [Epulopiscium sp. Nele67-Bin005]|nr:MAG: hypothetical protein ATN36_06915 [Epulopiscium sp. Nele67-Bin005]
MKSYELAQLLQEVEEAQNARKPLVIAIDGPCASGKTTLALKLKKLYNFVVIHMDHFFLRPEQRTLERELEVGGNIDYERFNKEVTASIEGGHPIIYRPYNCKTGNFGDEIKVDNYNYLIIEGSYSLHSAIKGNYDKRVFLTVSQELQRERLKKRFSSGQLNELAMLEQFKTKWIPLENAYFEHFNIMEKCDFILNTNLE